MDGACDSSFKKKTHFKLVWARCLRFLVFEKDVLQVCLGTVLAVVRFCGLRRPNLLGDSACDSWFLRRIHTRVFLKRSHLEFVWERCWRCFRGVLFPNLFGDGACDSLLSQKIYFKFVWGQCFRLIVLEEYFFRISFRRVFAILSF